MTTDEAFETLVNSDYYWSKTGLSHGHKRQTRFRLREGRGISTEKKEELLKLAGFGIEIVTSWKLPRSI